MTERKRRFAICSGLCGLTYLLSLFFTIPCFIRGFVLGVAIGLLILNLLPAETLKKLKKLKPWKCYGD